MTTSKLFKMGLTLGVMDCLHAGHVHLIERCFDFCDKLTIGLMQDDWVKQNKGKYPLFSLEERMNAIVEKFDNVTLYEADSLDVSPYMIDRKAEVFFHGNDWLETEGALYKILPKESREFFVEREIPCILLPYFKSISTSKIREKAELRFKIEQERL